MLHKTCGNCGREQLSGVAPQNRTGGSGNAKGRILVSYSTIQRYYAVAYLSGELDAYTVSCLRARLTPVVMTGRDIIVDLAGLSFLGAAGLIALADLQREATMAGGSLRLTEPAPLLRRVLDLAKVKDAFAVVGHAKTR